MYNFLLEDNEKIKLISDNTIVYNNENEFVCTSIITNKRYLILNYPSDIYNPRNDLRILGRINYLKQKELIFETKLKDIIYVDTENNYYKIGLPNNNYILIKDIDIINHLKNIVTNITKKA